MIASARFRRGHRPALALTLAAALAGCGGSGPGQTGSASAFTFLSVDGFSLTSASLVSQVNSAIDSGTDTSVCVTLRNNLKNPTVTGPTSLDNVVIQTYTVSLARADGVAVPGSPFTFNTAVLVPAGTAATASPTVSGNTATFPVVLVPSGVKIHPSIRPPTRLPVSATASIAFRGRDGRGQRVEADAAISLAFVNGDTETAVTCARTFGS